MLRPFNGLGIACFATGTFVGLTCKTSGTYVLTRRYMLFITCIPRNSLKICR
jgi:hypothetical protein